MTDEAIAVRLRRMWLELQGAPKEVQDVMLEDATDILEETSQVFAACVLRGKSWPEVVQMLRDEFGDLLGGEI